MNVRKTSIETRLLEALSSYRDSGEGALQFRAALVNTLCEVGGKAHALEVLRGYLTGEEVDPRAPQALAEFIQDLEEHLDEGTVTAIKDSGSSNWERTATEAAREVKLPELPQSTLEAVRVAGARLAGSVRSATIHRLHQVRTARQVASSASSTTGTSGMLALQLGGTSTSDSSDWFPMTREQRRSRRKREVRARTISIKRLTKRELALGRLLNPEQDHSRPRLRGECVEGPRPCPYVSCPHHLYLDVSPITGTIKLNFPDLEVWELGESCALDVADRGGTTLEDVGALMNLTRERIRQIEVKALSKLDAIRDMDALRECVDAGARGEQHLQLSHEELISLLDEWDNPYGDAELGEDNEELEPPSEHPDEDRTPRPDR